MFRASCPNNLGPICGAPILYDATTTHVRCSVCQSGDMEIERLVNVRTLGTTKEQTKALKAKALAMEQRGGFGEARAQMCSRMVDGILNYDHVKALWPYFEQYGVTSFTSNGRAEKLSKMGRIEPINVRAMSDYAFGIRNDHVFVSGYGVTFEVFDQLKPLLKKLNSSLVPISTVERRWMWQSAALVSRACVGREAFTRRLVIETIKHLQEYGDEYKKRSNCNEAFWQSIQAWDRTKGDAIQLTDVMNCDLDLAAMANVLGRSIVLLDAKTQSTANVFVPFLCPPENCRDRNERERAPIILLVQPDRDWMKSALVARANARTIKPVHLEKKWFNPIWGTTSKEDAHDLLSRYLRFGDDGRCLVAKGKYFKPRFMQKVVIEFEKMAVFEDSVHPRLVAEWTRDFKKYGTKTDIMEAVLNNDLWRCVKCDGLARSDDGKGRECKRCKTALSLRPQMMDGIVFYQDGDHTETPAPDSRCHLKRKHFYGGIEYDNEPQKIGLSFHVRESGVMEVVKWFSDETKHELNSDFSSVASNLAEKYNKFTRFGVTADSLIEEIATKIVDKLNADEASSEHFKQYLAAHKMDPKDVLDGSRWSSNAVNMPMATAGREWSPEDLEKHIYDLLDQGNAAAKNYANEYSDIVMAMSMKITDTLEVRLLRLNEKQTNIDQAIIYQLEEATACLTVEERIRMVTSKLSIFKARGFLYEFAKRAFLGQQHFWLPLFDKLPFSFGSDSELLVCMPGAHYKLTPDVINAMAGLIEAKAEYPCDFNLFEL